ncbi:MAG: FliM/FliN family flagellar motor switch protein [Planctomycetota bacterium]|jgi:flagellar motor switch protein FliM
MTKALNNNLSREKIQQLLAAVGSRKTEDDTQIEVTEFDWHQPHYFNNDKLEKLGDFSGKIASAIAEKFAELYNNNFTVTVTSTTQHFAKELLEQNQNNKQNDYYLSFGTEPDTPCGYLSISRQTAIDLVTQLLGDTKSEEDQDRTFSELEESLLLDILSRTIEAFSNSDSIYDFLTDKSIVKEQLPFEMQGIEELCKITFSIAKTGSKNSFEVHMLIFCDKLAAAIEETAQTNSQFSPEDISNAVLEHLHKMPLCVTGQLASTHLTFEQIISLVPDDILLLDKKIDESIEVIIQDQIVFRGWPAKSAGNYAVAITEINNK